MKWCKGLLWGVFVVAVCILFSQWKRDYVGLQANSVRATSKAPVDSPEPARSSLPTVLLRQAEHVSLVQELEEEAMRYSTESPNPAKARDKFRKILAFDPENEFALTGMATTPRDEEEISETASFFRELVKNNPDSPHVTQAAADFFMDHGDEATAITLFKKLSEVQVPSLYASSELARLYEKRGRLGEAAWAVNRAISVIESDDREVGWEERLGEKQLLLANLLINTGNFSEAEKATQAARQNLKDESKVDDLEERLREKDSQR